MNMIFYQIKYAFKSNKNNKIRFKTAEIFTLKAEKIIVVLSERCFGFLCTTVADILGFDFTIHFRLLCNVIVLSLLFKVVEIIFTRTLLWDF